MFGQLLTHSRFLGGEKGPPVTAAGARIRPAMATAETNGETENARNHGQYGTCRRSAAVNEVRVKTLWGKWYELLLAPRGPRGLL